MTDFENKNELDDINLNEDDSLNDFSLDDINLDDIDSEYSDELSDTGMSQEELHSIDLGSDIDFETSFESEALNASSLDEGSMDDFDLE